MQSTTEADRVHDELVAMVQAFNGGFHPDTSGEEYASYPEGYDADEVNRIIGEAWDFGFDIAEIALEAVTR